jgi:hypothetical protein
MQSPPVIGITGHDASHLAGFGRAGLDFELGKDEAKAGVRRLP